MFALSPVLTAALDGLDPAPIWERLRPHLIPTAFVSRPALDARVGAAVTLVVESQQRTGSFKFRAAASVALHTDAPRLLTASSGNFGAALAAAAALVGKSCTVVMPARSAQVKIAAVRSHGAQVELVDTARTTREARLAELAALDPAARVCSPYDDPYVISGNASLGAELLAALTPEVIVSPVGGGGLASGLVVATALLAPSTQVVGAEPALANDAARSLRAGALLANLEESNTICDGARTRSLGKRNFAILRERLSGIIEVSEEAIVQALALLASEAGLRVEPTGALGLAAVLAEPERFAAKQVAVVVSGANVDPDAYAQFLTWGDRKLANNV